MKALDAGLAAHIATGTTTLAWCWRVTLVTGTVLGFTDHDRDLTFDGTTFKAATGFTATDVRTELGAAVGELEVEAALSDDGITEEDLAAGLYDDAAVELWRVNWADVSQRHLEKVGNVGEVVRGEVAFRGEFRALAHRLQEPQGRVYQAACDATLGDARCGVDLEDAAYKGAGAIVSITGRLLTATGLGGFVDDWFARGSLTWATGANAGLKFDVVRFRTGTSATVVLSEAPVKAVLVGDTFTIRAGCDKRFETCKAKFANAVNFRGFPHMPGDDFAARYANTGDGGTGTTRYGTF